MLGCNIYVIIRPETDCNNISALSPSEYYPYKSASMKEYVAERP